MITIKIEIDSIYEFGNYLVEKTWQGAQDRVADMELEELKKLYNYLDALDTEMTDTELNDFIWFDWDDIKENL